MSDELIDTEIKETEQQDLLNSIKNFLATLVPPTNIVIEDIFGNSYELACSVSARNQIKILREFDKIKDIGSDFKFSADGSVGSLVDNIISIATDDQALLIICRCFSLGHGACLEQVKEVANANSTPYDAGDMACADLFALEELVTAIVPLFIRLAKRASQAVNRVLNK